MNTERLSALGTLLHNAEHDRNWIAYATIFRLIGVELDDNRMAMGGRPEGQSTINYAYESSQESWMRALGFSGNLKDLSAFMRANGYTDVRLAVIAMRESLTE